MRAVGLIPRKKKWADTRVEGFVFTCKGCTGVAAMAKEVDGLKQMVEDMKEMVAGLRFVDKGAEQSDDNRSKPG